MLVGVRKRPVFNDEYRGFAMGDYAVAGLIVVLLAAVSNFAETPGVSVSCVGADMGVFVVCR